MIDRLELEDVQLESPLGRASPLVKLGLALAWLVGLAFTLDPLPPIVVTAVVLVVGVTLGRIRFGRLAAGLAPLWLAALGITVFNTMFAGVNADPTQSVVAQLGPVRITEAAVAGGVGLGLRVVAIAAVGVVFGLTTDPTRLVDSLVQQGRLPERFAYGALAAYQAIPRLAEDLATLRQARRVRGLRGEWHPRILVGLLVLAIRHGDRLALAMDARAFGSMKRTTYRPLSWSTLDLAVAVTGAVVLFFALASARL